MVSELVKFEQRGKNIPKRLRAYIFADKKSQSPDNAASGVRQAMFVDFIICLR